MNTTTERLDSLDIQILRALQQNARLSVKELAAHVNRSSTPVYERMRRLENGGYIKKYVAVLDAEKLNQGFIVFCNVKLNKITHRFTECFAERVLEIPQVSECYNISGNYDFLLKIHAPDMKYYREFVLDVLGTIDNVGSVESVFVMDVVKCDYTLHI